MDLQFSPAVTARTIARRVGSLILAASLVTRLSGDVIVIDNPTSREIEFLGMTDNGTATKHRVRAGETITIDSRGPARIRIGAEANAVEYRLDANAVYFFALDADRPALHQIDLRSEPTDAAGRDLAPTDRSESVASIPVKILVDDEEPAVQALWEPRLRKRVSAASAILEPICRVRLEVVAVDQWESDDALRDFGARLRDFEQKVDPHPAWLAIGFTSQTLERHELGRIGGTRGLLRPHILVGEWGPGVTAAERLEILVHELGHFLGAGHSLEPDSVMRPILADGRVERRDVPIRFDVVNHLLINLVSEEIRVRGVKRASQLTPGTTRRLSQILSLLAESFPEDNAARQMQRLVDSVGLTPLQAATQVVMHSITDAATERVQQQRSASRTENAAGVLTGDALTDYYIRRAAEVAAKLPEELAPRAFILGIGLALDDSDTLRKNPLDAGFSDKVESPAIRAARLNVLGQPTMRGRRDLALHFICSAYLTAQSGTWVAGAAGLLKEATDAQSASGFSFADLAADQAGIRFAEKVLTKHFDLQGLAREFSVADYLPAVGDLPEGLSREAFQQRFGDGSNRQYRELIDLIQARIAALPPYQRLTATGP